MLLLAMCVCPGSVSCAENLKPSDYDIKAVYLFNFAKFVEWPAGAFRDGSSAIHICVIGSDPIGPSLSSLEGKRVGEKKIGIKRVPNHQNIYGCEILFIGGAEEEHLGQILNDNKSSWMLTVGDTAGFARKGVMINFFLENNKVRFEINQKAAGRASIRISSNLLRLARIVGEP